MNGRNVTHLQDSSGNISIENGGSKVSITTNGGRVSISNYQSSSGGDNVSYQSISVNGSGNSIFILNNKKSNGRNLNNQGFGDLSGISALNHGDTNTKKSQSPFGPNGWI